MQRETLDTYKTLKSKLGRNSDKVMFSLLTIADFSSLEDQKSRLLQLNFIADHYLKKGLTDFEVLRILVTPNYKLKNDQVISVHSAISDGNYSDQALINIGNRSFLKLA